VVFSIAACIVALRMEKVYRAAVLLVPAAAERNGMSASLGTALTQLGGLAALAGVNAGSGDVVTEESLAVLKSRQFTERFINDNSLIPILFAAKWDAAAKKWKVAASREPTPGKAYRFFDRRVRSIVRDKKTGLVSLQIDWPDRALAAAWANQLIQRLNDEMRDRAIAKADASIGFLEREVAKTAVVDTRAAISRLIETEEKQRMLANVNREYAFRVVDKAIAPDADDPVWPPKILIAALGSVLGLMVGIVVAIVLTRRRPSAVSAD
jgi:uncharacterized protein involved in exopolysaccharide biosynthesis